MKSDICKKCNERFAVYYCEICALYDNMGKEKQIFHCDKCAICRVGGKDNVYHCDECECCFPVIGKANHTCIKQRLKQGCPICLEDMQNSRNPSQQMRCGHSMHSSCLNDYLKTNMACPLCKKSLVDMTAYEAFYDAEFASYPMPLEYQDLVANLLKHQ